ncbi:hypothetical protein [Ancylomarina longa]|uniref:WxL domain-containing protein n=1 Tax=Ancylomarina longa TaxID=2487017 RepID=A0A434AGY9_9BACT|nr:hypothetical protein [Ancylomarina longa]RUT73654.1 hypothetical protein DLK05_12575 [Ancylomarina longa]
MKNLLKITMSLAMVLLISSSLFAQQSTNPATVPGTATVVVNPYLSFTVADASPNFTFDAGTPGNIVPTDQSTVDINSNVDWTFEVSTTASNLISTSNVLDVLPIGSISANINSTSAIALGNANTYINSNSITAMPIDWAMDYSAYGNPAYGTYTAPITYSLTRDGGW